MERLKSRLSDRIVKIGCVCKEKRIEKGFTQMDLAFYSDTETSTISKIERFAIENISIRTLLKISIVLEIDVKDFL